MSTTRVTFAKLPLRIKAVISEAAERNCTTPEAVVGLSQFSNIVQARTDVSKTLREMKFSYSVIGRFLNRDHSSVYHLVDRRKT